MNRGRGQGANSNSRYQKQQPIVAKPQPSIKSSQVFNEESQTQQQQQQQSAKPSMTIQQAITLITLRLGSIETKLANHPELYSGSNLGFGTDSESPSLEFEEKEQIFERLNALESKTSSAVDYKQCIDTLTQTIIQIKNSNTAILKENKELKLATNNLKQELNTTKELLENIKKTTSSNEMKILELVLAQKSQIDDDVLETNEGDELIGENIIIDA